MLLPVLRRMMRGITVPWLPLAFFVVILKSKRVAGQLGIPGATATKSGYDTEMGTDPMCWKSPADQAPGANLTVPNPLVANFKLAKEGVELLKECPEGNSLVATAPPEFIRGERLRTRRFYNYSVDISLDLRTLGGNYFVSDWGSRVAIQILICSLGDSGFCSPFIHEETNERLFKLGLPLKPAPGDRHGGSHVHSPYKMVDLHPHEGPTYQISLQVPMLVNEPGTYFAVAAIQMMVAQSEFVPVETRYDMANAMVQNDQRIITYQEPAIILEVPLGVKATSYIAIGISGSIILYLLVQTIHHREHQVIRLTQGVFLILFLTMALIATVCSFLFEPKNDPYCQASYPILLICLQFMYATTLGRLWRINSMISPMLVRTMAGHQSEDKKSSIRNCMEQAGSRLMEFTRLIAFVGTTENKGIGLGFGGSRRSGPRMMITDWHLARVIIFFTFPQVLMQILSVTLQPRRRVIEFNADESIGRATCHCDVPNSQSILNYSCYMFLILVMVLLTMAAGTRKLPSLFNETQDILDSAITSMILLVLGIAIILVTNEPTVSPGVQYLVWVVMAISLCLNFSLRIMMPKLNMVWNGEVVLVSKLVSDHNRNLQESERQQREGRTTTCFVSGIETDSRGPGLNSCVSTSSLENRLPTMESGLHDHDESGYNVEDDVDVEDDNDSQQLRELNSRIMSFDTDETDVTHPNGEESPTGSALAPEEAAPAPLSPSASSDRVALLTECAPPPEGSSSPRNCKASEHQQRKPPKKPMKRCRSRILVSKEAAPARRLVLKMVDLQEQLVAINGRIMSGLVVNEKDWEATRSLTKRLGEVFHDEVSFTWERTLGAPQADSSNNSNSNNNNNADHRIPPTIKLTTPSNVIEEVSGEDSLG